MLEPFWHQWCHHGGCGAPQDPVVSSWRVIFRADCRASGLTRSSLATFTPESLNLFLLYLEEEHWWRYKSSLDLFFSQHFEHISKLLVSAFMILMRYWLLVLWIWSRWTVSSLFMLQDCLLTVELKYISVVFLKLLYMLFFQFNTVKFYFLFLQ